jgi:hypothetical protein
VRFKQSQSAVDSSLVSAGSGDPDIRESSFFAKSPAHAYEIPRFFGERLVLLRPHAVQIRVTFFMHHAEH